MRLLTLFIVWFTIPTLVLGAPEDNCSDLFGNLGRRPAHYEAMEAERLLARQDLSLTEALADLTARSLEEEIRKGTEPANRSRYVAARQRAEAQLNHNIERVTQKDEAPLKGTLFFDEWVTTQDVLETLERVRLREGSLAARGDGNAEVRAPDLAAWVTETEGMLQNDSQIPSVDRQFVQTQAKLRESHQLPITTAYLAYLTALTEKAARVQDPTRIEIERAESLLFGDDSNRRLTDSEMIAIHRAHQIGLDREVEGDGPRIFSSQEIQQKARILRREGGFSPQQAELLIVERIAGEDQFSYEVNKTYGQQIAKLQLSQQQKDQIRAFRKAVKEKGGTEATEAGSTHALQGRLAGLFALEIGSSSSPFRLVYQVTDSNGVVVHGVGDHQIYDRVRPPQ